MATTQDGNDHPGQDANQGAINMRDEETKDDDQPPHQYKQQEGRIHFCTINVRLYPTVIGENPATFRGPSLEMAWKPVQQLIYSVDEYEKTRMAERRDKFVLAPGTRKRFLKHLGFTQEEIDDGEAAVQEVRRFREQSIQRMKKDWKDEYREERQEFVRRVFLCKPEEVLDYPDVPSPGKHNPYYNETQKVQPMFDKIPCSHCSSFACVGEGSDWPAMVGMFRCDGKYCKEVNVKVCPVTGQSISGVGYRRSTIFEKSMRLDPKPDDMEEEDSLTASSQEVLEPFDEIPTKSSPPVRLGDVDV